MKKTAANEQNAPGTGLERRRALQGLAGSLAGIAAFGAKSASAKKKKKKSTAGTLVRIQPAQQTASIPATSTDTVTATCPAAGNKEEVFAISGGFDVSTSPNVDDFIIRAAGASSTLEGWSVTFANQGLTAQNGTTTVLCAYFKRK